jgi:hypothetical protein
MEAMFYFETSRYLRATRRYNPENRTIRCHRCENLISSLQCQFVLLLNSIAFNQKASQ